MGIPPSNHPGDPPQSSSPSPAQVAALSTGQVIDEDVGVAFGVDLHQLQPKHLREDKG